MQRYQKSNDPIHHDFYKSLRNETNRAIRREKQAYFQHICRMNLDNRKNLWKQLQTLIIGKSKMHMIPDTLKNVELMNRHFSTSVSNPLNVTSQSLRSY